jgi:ornithine cyclodeaminase
MDYLFCATRACGAIRGCSKYVRERNLRTKIFTVDAVGGIIFGGHHPQTRRGWTSRAQPSAHLAEQLTDSRGFFQCTLADVLMGKAASSGNSESIVVFSPFGLGGLDLAVAGFVKKLGLAQGKGTIIESFLP